MRGQTHNHRGGPIPHNDAAMSFEEIGRELGITRGGAWMLYRSAMRKLKATRRLVYLRKLLELAKSKEISDL